MNKKFKKIRRRIDFVRQKIADRQQIGRIVQVPVKALLMGDEGGIDAKKYAILSGNPLRTSTPINKSPHAHLLQTYEQIGKDIFAPEYFKTLPYYLNGLKCLDLTGFYFDARREDEIIKVAQEFVNRDIGKSTTIRRRGQSPDNAPIMVRPIVASSYYQIKDGHHRSSLIARKEVDTVTVQIVDYPVSTLMQDLLLNVLWINGRKDLYQPVPIPEVENWKLVRKCSDRFTMMKDFLVENSLLSPNLQNYLDIGSSYGWFVSQMKYLGFQSLGVERDPLASKVGEICYGNLPEMTVNMDIVRFLTTSKDTFDIVSCLSVLHHYVLGKGAVPAEDFIQLLAQKTKKILFLDTGQSHEKWFSNELNAWTTEFIPKWILTHSSFSNVIPLGKDTDDDGEFKGNYGRTLFACLK